MCVCTNIARKRTAPLSWNAHTQLPQGATEGQVFRCKNDHALRYNVSIPRVRLAINLVTDFGVTLFICIIAPLDDLRVSVQFCYPRKSVLLPQQWKSKFRRQAWCREG